MAIHEALEILDPTEQTPHDMYAILTYAAAAHPDVAQMMDRFARFHRSRVLGEQRQREEAAAMGVEPRLITIPAPAPLPKKRRTGRPHGSYTRPKEVIEAERASKEARRAEIRAAREARRARKTAEARKKKESAKDKDFAYLVRRAEEELGWTGKYDNEVKPKPKPKPASSSAKKKKDWYYYKATDVKDSLMWMMKQLLREMSDSTRMVRSGSVIIQATYGTKKNALFAMSGIIHAVLVDASDIGTHLRESWFAGLEDAFEKAVRLLSIGELATLRKDKRWINDLRELLRIVREQKLEEKTLKDIFSMVVSTAGNGGSEGPEGEDEGMSDEESSPGVESSEEEDADGDSEDESPEEEELSDEESSEEETSDEESSEGE